MKSKDRIEKMIADLGGRYADDVAFNRGVRAALVWVLDEDAAPKREGVVVRDEAVEARRYEQTLALHGSGFIR